MACAVVFLVVDNYVPSEIGEPAAASTTTTADEAGEEPDVLPNSIAVLPFANLSPNPEDAYFAAGIHDEILNQLGKLRNLSVISRTSVLRYQDTDLSIPEIARELNVSTIMEGTVRYAGDRVRVTTQLVDARTDGHLWTETYERAFEDIFAIESDIAMNVANALRTEFSLEDQERIERVPTQSPEAYALFLEARAQPNPFGALDLLEEAVRVDPEFAVAHAWIAFLLAQTMINTTFSDAATSREAESRVLASANRALSVDPNLPDAQPNIATPLTGLSLAYAHAGDPERAIDAAQQALALEPNGVLARLGVAMNAVRLRDGPEAARQMRLVERLMGANRFLIYVAQLAVAYQLIGSETDVARLLAELEEITSGIQNQGSAGQASAGLDAMISLARGDRAATLSALETAVAKVEREELDSGFNELMNIKNNVLAHPMLEEPRFRELRDRLGSL